MHEILILSVGRLQCDTKIVFGLVVVCRKHVEKQELSVESLGSVCQLVGPVGRTCEANKRQ